MSLVEFNRLDKAFARFMRQQSLLQGQQAAEFEQLILRLSFQQNQGHICIPLSAAERTLAIASGLVSDGERTPLILDGGRLYTHRYWQYEIRVVKRLQNLLDSDIPVFNGEKILDQLFSATDNKVIWQREAAQKALCSRLTVISGGPGTGKTTTVVKILALLQQINEQPLHIALAAPTGKAARRLQESIALQKQTLACSEEIRQNIPEQAVTLHSLLGVKAQSPYFHHNQQNPLPHDLLVVDEASMIDLALMSKLLDALKQHAGLILLGDKDQLSSVEAGSVLADLTGALANNTAELKETFRFEQQIKALADAVNQQNADLAWGLLQDNEQHTSLLTEPVIPFIAKRQQAYLQKIRQGATVQEIFQTFNSFQVICCHRKGKHSVQEINQHVRQQLLEEGYLQGDKPWYIGRPVMITQNTPDLELFNGDIGICLPDRENHHQLSVAFSKPDGNVKTFLPGRLPHCETVFAMTIHKSQGSEFSEVLIMLPDQISPVLSKELLYTAITRAKNKVTLTADQTVFKQCIQTRVQRSGGLLEKL